MFLFGAQLWPNKQPKVTKTSSPKLFPCRSPSPWPWTWSWPAALASPAWWRLWRSHTPQPWLRRKPNAIALVMEVCPRAPCATWRANYLGFLDMFLVLLIEYTVVLEHGGPFENLGWFVLREIVCFGAVFVFCCWFKFNWLLKHTISAIGQQTNGWFFDPTDSFTREQKNLLLGWSSWSGLTMPGCTIHPFFPLSCTVGNLELSDARPRLLWHILGGEFLHQGENLQLQQRPSGCEGPVSLLFSNGEFRSTTWCGMRIVYFCLFLWICAVLLIEVNESCCGMTEYPHLHGFSRVELFEFLQVFWVAHSDPQFLPQFSVSVLKPAINSSPSDSKLWLR